MGKRRLFISPEPGLPDDLVPLSTPVSWWICEADPILRRGYWNLED